MDIWYMFASRGIDLLKPNSGTLAFIATNNWVTNAGATKLREKIAREAVISELTDFGDFKVFRDAAIQTMILILRKETPPNEYTFDYRKLVGSDRSLDEAQQLLERKSGAGLLYLTPSLKRNRVPSTPLTFAQSHLEAILRKVERASLSKEDMTQGIVAPQDFLSSAAALKLGQGYRNGEGIFVLPNSDVKRLKLSHDEKVLLRPYYTTKELRRYYGNSENQFWIIYTDSRFKNWRAMTPYPLLKAHLDRFKKVITSHYRPYGLHRSRNEHFFTGEKIIALRKAHRPTFTYTDFPCYVSQTFNVIKRSGLVVNISPPF